MKQVLLYCLFSFGLTYTLWLFYLAVMNLARAKHNGTLSKAALIFGTPILLVGYLVDFLTNILVMTVVFVDWPEETTVTARLKRYAAGNDGWRKTFTLWFANDLLDTFDPSGKHI